MQEQSSSINYPSFSTPEQQTQHICIKTLDGKNIQLQVNFKHTNMIQLKDYIQHKIGIKKQRLKIIYGGSEMSDDKKTLAEYNIKKGYSLFMVIKPQETPSNQLIEILLDIPQKQNQGKSQGSNTQLKSIIKPKYLDGLNIEGTCTNPNCQKQGKLIYCGKGFGDFNIAQEIFQCICPYCQAQIEQPSNFGFYKAKYLIKARYDKQSETFKLQDISDGDKYYRFLNSDEKFSKFNFILVKVQKI